MGDAIEVIDSMIVEAARAATRMAIANPQDFERLNASTGVGIRIQALVDARDAVRHARMVELEEEAKGR